MTHYVPTPGDVVRFGFLWRRDVEDGHDRPMRHRPCLVLAASFLESGKHEVLVVPFTHNIQYDSTWLQVPEAMLNGMGLDPRGNYVVVSEANSFIAPSPDLGDGKGLLLGRASPSMLRRVGAAVAEARARDDFDVIDRTALDAEIVRSWRQSR